MYLCVADKDVADKVEQLWYVRNENVGIIPTKDWKEFLLVQFFV